MAKRTPTLSPPASPVEAVFSGKTRPRRQRTHQWQRLGAGGRSPRAEFACFRLTIALNGQIERLRPPPSSSSGALGGLYSSRTAVQCASNGCPGASWVPTIELGDPIVTCSHSPAAERSVAQTESCCSTRVPQTRPSRLCACRRPSTAACACHSGRGDTRCHSASAPVQHRDGAQQPRQELLGCASHSLRAEDGRTAAVAAAIGPRKHTDRYLSSSGTYGSDRM